MGHVCNKLVSAVRPWTFAVRINIVRSIPTLFFTRSPRHRELLGCMIKKKSAHGVRVDLIGVVAAVVGGNRSSTAGAIEQTALIAAHVPAVAC